MTAVDTSVVVAAFASWHQGHDSAIAALTRGPRLPAHVACETFAVLTRLPPPHRAPGHLASEFLRAWFPSAPITLPARTHLALLSELVELGLTGGAVYDALVGATARHAGATLLTRDRRATRVYEALGVSYEIVG